MRVRHASKTKHKLQDCPMVLDNGPFVYLVQCVLSCDELGQIASGNPNLKIQK